MVEQAINNLGGGGSQNKILLVNLGGGGGGGGLDSLLENFDFKSSERLRSYFYCMKMRSYFVVSK